jgi:hypothetical protein
MKKLTIQEIKQIIIDRRLTISLLSDVYVSTHCKLKFKCLLDGHEWSTAWSAISSGHGCPECKRRAIGLAKRYNIGVVKEKLAEINPKITILSDHYENNRTKLSCICCECGHEWKANANNLLLGKGCPPCSSKKIAEIQKLSFSEVIARIGKANPNILVANQPYDGIFKNILVSCMVCGHNWSAMPSNLFKGHGCPKCNTSKGERRVEQWLKNNKITYKTQYRFDACRHKYTLPFDFAIFNQNKLACLIEYQGVQHYKADSYYGGLVAFEYTQNNDKIKKRFCKNKQIPLIEIPYTVKNIDGFLSGNIYRMIGERR